MSEEEPKPRIIVEICKRPTRKYEMTEPYIRKWDKHNALIYAKFCDYNELITVLKSLGYKKDCLTFQMVID